jgi:peptide/nickel transport system ATP-binding protein
MSSLQVENLTIETKSGIHLVDSLSFNLSTGSRLSLLGESGSGKSLTSLAITGLLNPNLISSGSITYDQIQILGATESELCKIRGAEIGIVFQDPLASLDPVMKIGKQLAKPLKLHQGVQSDELAARAEAALAEVKISSPYRIAHSYPHEISGGERQRVALALTLACLPKILIADEITTSLDVSVQAEILSLLESIIDSRSMSLIFITHDIAVAAAIADDVLIMRNGRLVESGKMRDVLRVPQSEYATTLIQSARSLSALLTTVSDGGIQ